MANKRIGSMPAHTTVVERIDSAKQLVPGDSGKLFLCYAKTALAAYVINLPKLTEDIAGWQAKFLIVTLESAIVGKGAISILAYGMTAADTPSDWGSGPSYSIGNIVLYSGITYTCLVSHTSTDDTDEDTGRPNSATNSWAVLGAADKNTVYGVDISATTALISGKDGTQFAAAKAHAPSIMEWHTDGTTWFVHTQSSTDTDLVTVGS